MTLQTSVPFLILSVAAIAAAILLSTLALRRSGFSARIVFLELLRLAIVILAIVTLQKPEVVRSQLPEKRATVVILRDISKSMQTRDESRDGMPISRDEAIQLLDDRSWLNQLGDETNFVVQPFGFEATQSNLGTDIHSALKAAMDRYNDLRAVVLVSDGDWNFGEPPSAIAQRFRFAKIQVHAVSVGQSTKLPDTGIRSFEVPAFAIKGKPLRLPFAIESSLNQDVDLPVTLELSTGESITQTIRVPAKGQASSSFEVRPKQEGDLSFHLSISQLPQDQIEDNNARRATTRVRVESLKALLVESYPRWEYRYIRNALERDPGVDVDCLLFHPEMGEMGDGRNYLTAFPNDEQLFAYDVVFIGDVGLKSSASDGELTVDQCLSLKRLVESHSGGLVLIPGLRGSQIQLLQSPLSDLFPVEFDADHPRGLGSDQVGHYQLTELGNTSLLTRLESTDSENQNLWRSLPGFYWHAGVHRAKPGCQVLATHDSSSSSVGRRPLIVTKTFGNGKVLFMGCDGAWRWRKGVEDKYHYRFWGQVVRWMAYQRSMAEGQSLRLIYSPDRPRQGEVVLLQANAMSSTGEPLNRGTITAQIESPSGQVDSVNFNRGSGDLWGLFEANFKPNEGGRYRLSLHCLETGAQLSTEIVVEGLERELVGRPSRLEVLQELTSMTGGQNCTADRLPRLLRELSVSPHIEPVQKKIRLWCHPAWGGLLIGLLSLFWAARKYGGLL